MQDKNNHKKAKGRGALKQALIVALGTFFLACAITVVSQLVMGKLSSFYIAASILLIVIAVGIFFDVIGVAVTVADEAPFHAKAARKIPGANQCLRLIKNASKVANMCNDLIGDVCGTVSGGLATALVYALVSREDPFANVLDVVIVGIVSALTVGGKSYFKNVAINSSEAIVFRVGQFLAFWDKMKWKSKKTGGK